MQLRHLVLGALQLKLEVARLLLLIRQRPFECCYLRVRDVGRGRRLRRVLLLGLLQLAPQRHDLLARLRELLLCVLQLLLQGWLLRLRCLKLRPSLRKRRVCALFLLAQLLDLGAQLADRLLVLLNQPL